MARDDSERADEIATALREQRSLDAPAAYFALVVLEGPDRGKRYSISALSPGRTLIGQSPACEIRLTDRSVSRRHAAVAVEEGRVRVTDLGSTNGTVVDGVRVLDAYLQPGHVVRLGDTALSLQIDEPRKELPISNATRFGRTIGASLEMRRLYPLCERLAAATVPVLIEGETGTGKEVLAESIHQASPRADGPFLVFDCTAVPPNLVESELFGHERGAFTGAVSARKGMLEQAEGGTLLIDEIGELELSMQPKLLRAIEGGAVRRIGGSRTQPVDVRILCATRRDLDHEVQAGRFRDDLFHRLAVGRIELPPLRRRTGDVVFLAKHFWRDLGGGADPLPDDALLRYAEYGWPGNVRELRNAIARRLALGDFASVSAQRIAPPVAGARAAEDFLDTVVASRIPLPLGRRKVITEFERRYILQVLEDHGGNVGKAAEASGIARRYFQMIRSRAKGPGDA